MPPSASHPRWPRRFILELALLGTLLFHGGLAVLLRFREPQPAASSSTAAGIATAILPGLPASPAEDALLEWADVHDPASLVLPNPQHGFSRFLTVTPPLPWTPPLDTRNHPVPTAGAEPAAIPLLPEPGIPLPADLQAHWPASLPETAYDHHDDDNMPAATLSAADRPLWRFADGVLLPAPPALDLDACRQAAAVTPPATPSRFLVMLPTAPGAAARLRLETGSGNRDLDLLAWQALGGLVRTWETDRDRRQISADLAARLPANALPLAVEIEWRTLRPAPAAPPTAPSARP